MAMNYRGRRVAGAILAIGLIGGFWMMAGAAPPAAPPATQLSADQIARQRYEAAQEGYRVAAEGFRSGTVSSEEVFQWLHRRMHARLELAKSPAERIKALEQNVEEFRAEQKEVEARHQAGIATSSSIYLARYNLLDAELMLAREREAGAAK